MGLDDVELVMQIEASLGIDLPDEVWSRAQTAGQLHAVVIEAMRSPTQFMEECPCWKCGYNLRGLRDPRCPECDAPFVFRDNLDTEVVWGILVELISEQLAIKPERVKPGARLVKDLRMNR